VRQGIDRRSRSNISKTLELRGVPDENAVARLFICGPDGQEIKQLGVVRLMPMRLGHMRLVADRDQPLGRGLHQRLRDPSRLRGSRRTLPLALCDLLHGLTESPGTCDRGSAPT
jgi:hypothetical protein